LGAPGPIQVPLNNPAIAGLEQGADETRQAADSVITGVRRLQVLNDVSEARSDFANTHDNIITGTFANQAKMNQYYGMSDPVAAVQAFHTDLMAQTKTIQAATMKQYPSIGYELNPELNEVARQGLRNANLRFLSQYEQNARDRYGTTVMQSNIQLALSQGGIDPATGQPRNDKVKRTIADYLDGLNKAPGFLPNEKVEKGIQYHQLLSTMSLQQDAMANPGAVMTMSGPPPGVTPTAFKAIQDDALSSTTLNARRVDAGMKAKQAQNDDMVLQSITNHTPVPNLEYLRAHRQVSEEVYELKTGMTYTESFSSEPGAKDQYAKQISSANPEDLPAIEQQLSYAHSNKILSGLDTADLMLQAHKAATTGKTEIDVAKKHFNDLLNSEFYPPKMTGIPTFEVVVPHATADAHWAALTAAAKTSADYADAYPKMQQWMLEQKKRGYGAPGSPAEGAVKRLIPPGK
jgi:hypothetical protein